MIASPLYTTFALARTNGACDPALSWALDYGFARDRRSLMDNAPVTLAEILHNAPPRHSMDSALWSLRAVPALQQPRARAIGRLFSADCIERALPLWTASYPDDDRPRQGIDVLRAWAIGAASDDDLAAVDDLAFSMAHKANSDHNQDPGSSRVQAASRVAHALRSALYLGRGGESAAHVWSVEAVVAGVYPPRDRTDETVDRVNQLRDAERAYLAARLALYLDGQPLPPVEPFNLPAKAAA